MIGKFQRHLAPQIGIYLKSIDDVTHIFNDFCHLKASSHTCAHKTSRAALGTSANKTIFENTLLINLHHFLFY